MNDLLSSLKTTRQVAQENGWSVSNLRQGIHDGRFPAPKLKINGGWLWSAEEIEAARKGLAIDRRMRGLRRHLAGGAA